MCEREQGMDNILYVLERADKFVYHYTKPESLAEHVLPTEHIRFSRFTHTNDPRECKDWKLGLWTPEGCKDFTHHEWELLQIQASSLLREQCRLFCATNDDDSAVGMGLDKIYGRGFCKPRMWDQYAARHTGACLIIDRVRFDAQIRKAVSPDVVVHCGPVSYHNHSQVPSLPVDPFILNGDDVRSLGVSPAIHKHLARYHREIFFQKPRDWADERELRWLLHLLSDDELDVPFGDSLAGIVVTPDFPPKYQRVIANYADAHRIEVGERRWRNCSPEMVPSILGCVRAARA
jgi:hypothetical protein